MLGKEQLSDAAIDVSEDLRPNASMTSHWPIGADQRSTLARRSGMNVKEWISSAESYRVTLHLSGTVRVESVFVPHVQTQLLGRETTHQLLLPYHGLLAYKVGTREWLVDSTNVLCVCPGWDFVKAHPVPGLGHGALIVTFPDDVVEQVCGSRISEASPGFLQGSIPSPRPLQLLTYGLLGRDPGGWPALAVDEWVISALGQLTSSSARRVRCSRAVKKAKEVLHACGAARLSLGQIAELSGVHPAYLTQEFTRCEGMPLYQYQLRLWLNRALLELPHCENITDLAFNLGFSSHSHFTAVFRRGYGISPSEFRAKLAYSFDRPQPRRARKSRKRSATSL